MGRLVAAAWRSLRSPGPMKEKGSVLSRFRVLSTSAAGRGEMSQRFRSVTTPFSIACFVAIMPGFPQTEAAEHEQEHEHEHVVVAGLIDTLDKAFELPETYGFGPAIESNARVHLDVPADASVVINGYFIPGRGRYRYFQVPPNLFGDLTPVQVFVPGGWDDEGNQVVQKVTRKLRLFPGQLVTIKAWPKQDQGKEHDAHDTRADAPSPDRRSDNDDTNDTREPTPPDAGATETGRTATMPGHVDALEYSSARIRYKNDGAVLQFEWDDDDLRIVVPHPLRMPHQPKRPGATGKINYVIRYVQAENPRCDPLDLAEKQDSPAGIGGKWDVAITDESAIINSASVKHLQTDIEKHLKLKHNATEIIIYGQCLTVQGLTDGAVTLEINKPLLSIRLRPNG